MEGNTWVQAVWASIIHCMGIMIPNELLAHILHTLEMGVYACVYVLEGMPLVIICAPRLQHGLKEGSLGVF